MIINGLKLVWADEFDAGSLDRSLWEIYTKKYKADSPDNCVFIKDNRLYIGGDINDKSTDIYGCDIQTKRSIHFKYGYLEIKVKLARGPAAWSTFWLNSSSLPFDRLPEVDIYENFGRDDRIAHNLHRWWYDKDENGNKIHTAEHLHHDQFAQQTHWTLRNTYLPDGECFYEKFHCVGLHWTPEKMDFYLDGQCAVSVDITGEYFKDFHQPMHIILGHEIKPEHAGISDTDNPSYDIFEYIRLYQDENGVFQDRRKQEITL